MEHEENTNDAVRLLVEAVKSSVDTSPLVKTALENLKFMGYIPNFTVKMDLELLRPAMEGLTDTRVRIA